MNQSSQQYFEIDVLQVFKKICSKLFFIIVVAILFSTVSVVYSFLFVESEYVSTTKVYLISTQDTNAKQLTLQDVQIGNALVNDYKQVASSSGVLNEVIQRTQVKIDAETLATKIQIESPKDTRILGISVSDKKPEVAALLANTVRLVSAEKFKEITKINDVGVFEEASIPSSPSSPNIKKNGLISFGLGIAVVVVIIVIRELMDERIKRPEDVEEILGLILLGYIPQAKKIGRMR